MKILVLSDSHGNMDNMVQAVEREQPAMIFHLGDCWRDGMRLHKWFPELPFEQVPGNCDFRSLEAAEKLLFLGDKRVLLCHGHGGGTESGPVPLRPYPQAPGGHAGKNPVPEPRKRRRVRPPRLWRRYPGGGKAERQNGSPVAPGIQNLYSQPLNAV